MTARGLSAVLAKKPEMELQWNYSMYDAQVEQLNTPKHRYRERQSDLATWPEHPYLPKGLCGRAMEHAPCR